ncbi:recombinase family protein [Dactylosporangium sp. CA-139066]|uniref:recombinase family protein n=1 Tax=Dactylosporangium sp. CA-139066 TaxID=3239930 RepID=UPI003D936235
MPRRRPKTQPATTSATRVALYVRVSSLMGREGDGFHSPEVQLDGMRGLIHREGLRETAVIDDDIDVSGQTFDRPGIRRIRDLVEAREIDVVAVFMLNRVGRNLAESLLFVRWLRERGVRIMSASEKIDDSPEGQFMVGLFLNMAELQGNQIGQTWARIIERRARLGLAHGNAAQGYRRTGDGLEIDPILGPVVTDMFRAYADGELVADITDKLAAARGRPVAKSRVKVMLRNPLYAGRIVVESSTGGTIDVPGVHPPLVDAETWNRAQQRMARDAVTPPRHLAPAYSLTGLLLCAHCDKHLQVWHSTEHGKDKPTRRIVCKHGKEVQTCKGVGSPLYAPIEQRVLDEVVDYARHLPVDQVALARRQATVDRAAASLPSVEAERLRIREAMAKLTKRWALGKVPDAAYETNIADFEADLGRLETREAQLRQATRMPAPAKLRKAVEEMLELWPDANGTERNTLLRSVVSDVTVRKAAYWREPPEALVTRVRFHWTYDE